MYYATSYHFFVHKDGVLQATETWVVDFDSISDRKKTIKWFNKFIEQYAPDYKGCVYYKFLYEDQDESFLKDDTLTIHVRQHYKYNKK